MDGDTEPITGVTPVDLDSRHITRVRLVDWVKVLVSVDALPQGTWGLIGEFDQSLRSNIRRGSYKSIDPALYEVRTERIEGKPRSRAWLYMRRKQVDG